MGRLVSHFFFTSFTLFLSSSSLFIFTFLHFLFTSSNKVFTLLSIEELLSITFALLLFFNSVGVGSVGVGSVGVGSGVAGVVAGSGVVGVGLPFEAGLVRRKGLWRCRWVRSRIVG